MIRRVLLDSSTIIAMYDTGGETAVEVREAAAERVLALADDPCVRFVINPLRSATKFFGAYLGPTRADVSIDCGPFSTSSRRWT